MLMIKASSGSRCQGAELVEERQRLQKMVETEPKLFVIQGDVYEVEKLVGVKTVKGKRLYRVRWRGYGKESDTLEPEENLFSCKDMIEDLEAKLKERHERKKGKKLLKTQAISKEPINTEAEVNKMATATWQATEIQPIGAHSKDTFWRDFDEGKITVAGAVYEKDMYSKVKERAARTNNSGEPSKSGETSPQKENPPPPLCPKVLLKRKPCNRTTDSLGFKSPLKKPISLQVRKRKKYDVLRDYRRRKSRIHRKRNIDENGRHKLLKSLAKHDSFSVENGLSSSNILQELLINDEKGTTFPEYVLNSLKSESEKMNCVFKNNCKDSSCGEVLGTDGRKSQSLICKISMQENSMTAYPAFSQRSGRVNQLHQNEAGTRMNIMVAKMFSSLIDGIVNEKLEKVERFCKNGYIVNCCRGDGTTALMVAAHLGRYYSTRILLKANAHKDKQNQKGETALMLACKNKHSEVVKLLLEHGANFALTNSDGVNVLKISNQCGNQTTMHNILIEHIVRVVSKFESEARLLIDPIAQIKYALFPIQCFSLNEGPVYSINFHHHVKLESPEKNGNQNLLFIAHSTFHEKAVHCQFDVESVIYNVTINGIKQDTFEDVSSVFKVTGLQNGSNRVSITTVHSPQSEVKLIVCAYKVHRTVVCFPSQKLKGDF
ncbi:M-phase phosphoprotein 8 [Parasteatoda tepidariorum]|uniref:M-phase phosphoprotein 8 n=1 Tax=Parasteatoda tepidariorum TaxID=114398 RepID=UPI00077FD50C|nr:M-phase phosphoprotein 8 [Parasteatoda tepidariorum]